MIWRAASALFGNRAREADNHAGLQGVRTHENGIHLYKSNEATHVVSRQLPDYLALGWFLAFASGVSQFAVLPLFYMSIQMPRRLSTMKYFAFHAELLPHTEQVVFHKVNMFGSLERYYVDIYNLEKVDAADVAAPLMWEINMFDPDLIFRDASTGEVFVFDKLGHWNKEALEHPLLY